MQLGLISNNVKGPQSYKKWFEYLKNKSGPNDILFLQETHSMQENEIRWNNDFKSEMHYSHSKSNSCSIVSPFFDSTAYTVRKKW